MIPKKFEYKKVRVYQTVPPSTITSQWQTFARLLFNFTSDSEKYGLASFKIDKQTGYWVYKYHWEKNRFSGSIGVQTRADATKILENFMKNANDKIDTAVKQKVLPTDFPILFGKYQKLQTVTPIEKAKYDDRAKIWRFEYRIELPAADFVKPVDEKYEDLIAQDKGVVQNSSIIIEVLGGNVSRVDYQRLPTIAVTRKRMFNLLGEPDEVEAYHKVANVVYKAFPETGQVLPFVQTINGEVMPICEEAVIAQQNDLKKVEQSKNDIIGRGFNYEQLEEEHDGKKWTVENVTLRMDIVNDCSIKNEPTLLQLLGELKVGLEKVWNYTDEKTLTIYRMAILFPDSSKKFGTLCNGEEQPYKYDTRTPYNFINQFKKGEDGYEKINIDKELKFIFIKFIDYTDGAWGGTIALDKEDNKIEKSFINLPIRHFLKPQEKTKTEYRLEYDTPVIATSTTFFPTQIILRTLAHELFTHICMDEHLIDAKSSEHSVWKLAQEEREKWLKSANGQEKPIWNDGANKDDYPNIWLTRYLLTQTPEDNSGGILANELTNLRDYTVEEKVSINSAISQKDKEKKEWIVFRKRIKEYPYFFYASEHATFMTIKMRNLILERIKRVGR
jgi:hypothetical protein